jgi:hypothetical protein
VIVVETPIFTRRVCDFLPDEEIRRLQLALLLRPEQGLLIPAGGGLRKLRWKKPGGGKRGGLRILYYWDKPADRIYMIYAYDKRVQADLTKSQVKSLARLVREELK